MDKLYKALERADLDYGNLVFELKSGSGFGLLKHFDIEPKELIRFAEQDLENRTRRGLINSICNSKRAIDCQIDSYLTQFEIEFRKLPKAAQCLIKSDENNKKSKVGLIESLKVAPSKLISRARSLRNQVEHEYEMPNRNEVEDALEIAKLFTLSCESKIKMIDDDYIISSSNYGYIANEAYNENILNEFFSNHLRIYSNYDPKVRINIDVVIDRKKVFHFNYYPHNPEFYFLLRMINTNDDRTDFEESFSMLLNFIDLDYKESKLFFIEF